MKKVIKQKQAESGKPKRSGMETAMAPQRAAAAASPALPSGRTHDGGQKIVDKPSPEKKEDATTGESFSVLPATCGIEKKHITLSHHCEVTFRLPAEAAREAQTVTLVGDFNGWDMKSTPLVRLESGDFVARIRLDEGREYRFRYLIDGEKWENDWHADKYVKSPYGVEDSVVCT